jgi:hypothetical protein
MVVSSAINPKDVRQTCRYCKRNFNRQRCKRNTHETIAMPNRKSTLNYNAMPWSTQIEYIASNKRGLYSSIPEHEFTSSPPINLSQPRDLQRLPRPKPLVYFLKPTQLISKKINSRSFKKTYPQRNETPSQTNNHSPSNTLPSPSGKSFLDGAKVHFTVVRHFDQSCPGKSIPRPRRLQ